jgi:hypothetical protein
MKKEEERKILRRACKAIESLINGVYDDPNLCYFGYLFTEKEKNIEMIFQKTKEELMDS